MKGLSDEEVKEIFAMSDEECDAFLKDYKDPNNKTKTLCGMARYHSSYWFPKTFIVYHQKLYERVNGKYWRVTK
jgi:hypothetical protein